MPQWSARWGGWQAPFATAAILAAVGVIVLAAAPRGRMRTATLSPGLPGFGDRRLLRLAAMHSASFGLSVVIANWVVTLLERHDDASAEIAGVAARLTLMLGIVTRPAGGRSYVRAGLLRASFLAGGAGTAALAVAPNLGLAAAAVVGLAAGLPFASAFTGAARLRPDAPGAAIGFVNMAAALTILVGTPLVGLSFSLPGDGTVRLRGRRSALGADRALCAPCRDDWIQSEPISDPGCLISCGGAPFRAQIGSETSFDGIRERRDNPYGTGTRAVHADVVAPDGTSRRHAPAHDQAEARQGDGPPAGVRLRAVRGHRLHRRYRRRGQLVRAPACPNCGYGGANVSMMLLVGGTEVHARCTCGHMWLPGQKPVYVVTGAETAECTCPDSCERDHAND